MKAQQIFFEPVSIEHVPLLFQWLNAPHIVGKYDEGFSSSEEVKKKYATPQNGVQRFVVSYEGTPFGYIQSYQISTEHPYAHFMKASGETVGVDLFIGEVSHLNKGMGMAMLKAFIPFLGRDISRVIVDPRKGSGAVPFFKRYGFTEAGEEKELLILAIDVRHTARALLFNKKDELLLMQIEDTTTEDPERKGSHFWVTIGGAIEDGESPMAAVSREVVEETGIERFEIGELAFTGEHTLLFRGFPVRLFENFYRVSTHSEQTHQKNLTENEKEVFREMRWWSLEELLATDETVYPQSLGKELQFLLSGGTVPKEIVLS